MLPEIDTSEFPELPDGWEVALDEHDPTIEPAIEFPVEDGKEFLAAQTYLDEDQT